MKKFFQSGGAFMMIALLFFGAALLSDNAGPLGVVGAFWLVMGIAMRAKNARKQPSPDSASPTGRDVS